MCFLCLAVANILLVAQESLPDGWQHPTAAEANGAWRQKSSTRFLSAKGDFDGDGRPDVAYLLVDRSRKQFALWAKLTSTKKWLMLGEPSDLKFLDRFGIELVEPGKYRTACGKGYGDYACAHGEPDVLELAHAAIEFSYTEASDRIFYWDAKTREFREILMTD